MKRRNLLLSTIAGVLPAIESRKTLAVGSKKFFIKILASGGWDTSSFCDPKMNVSGQPIINNWAETNEVRHSGNLTYAPFAGNESFFTKHYQNMLVINGVDSQTSAHNQGVRSVSTGRLANGYPDITALYAAVYGSDLALPLLTMGLNTDTSQIIRATVLNGLGNLNNVLFHRGITDHDGEPFMRSRVDYYLEKNFREKYGSITSSTTSNLSKSHYLESMLSRSSLESLQPFFTNDASRNALEGNIYAALACMKAGVSISANIGWGGFDTHAYHDNEHEPNLRTVTEGIDYLWTTAEQMGIDDNLTLLVCSDFSRTPYYNSGSGKDHWQIGSYIVMEKNVTFTNQTLGGTDELLFAKKFLPDTLEESTLGINLTAGHVNQSLRTHLGLEFDEISELFPLNLNHKVHFFK
jgi:hypothetical protein